jgi:hypothetical protein
MEKSLLSHLEGSQQIFTLWTQFELKKHLAPKESGRKLETKSYRARGFLLSEKK